MALRLPVQQCMKLTSYSPTASLCRAFSTSAITLTQQPKNVIKKRRRDPWAEEQARARKAANVSRQQVLKAERAVAAGDPIRGTETDFVRSFDSPPEVDEAGHSADGQLNFFVKSSELENNLKKSAWLMTPTEEPTKEVYGDDVVTKEEREAQQQKHKLETENAAEAIRRINNLSLGSSKDRLRVNVQRCINILGRHNTDTTLPARATVVDRTDGGTQTAMPRIGLDTGSSEVQIGILTAKIRTLTQSLEGRGKQDKHNRRNLTVLVHKRQRLLRYLQRKEKGGPRWQNLIQTLGLTDGTWKGEITLPRYI